MTKVEAKRRQWIARWHRRLALLICIWLILLAVSGFLVNHANDWGLDRAPLPAVLQQGFYGIEVSDHGECPGSVISAEECRRVFARFTVSPGSVWVSTQKLFLVDGDGALVETLSAGSLGLASLAAVLMTDGQFYFRGPDSVVRSDLELMNSERISTEDVASLSAQDWQQAGSELTSITWERLLLDLHAARFLGPLAKWFNDLVALMILALALSGVWMYFRRRNGNGNQK